MNKKSIGIHEYYFYNQGLCNILIMLESLNNLDNYHGIFRLHCYDHMNHQEIVMIMNEWLCYFTKYCQQLLLILL